MRRTFAALLALTPMLVLAADPPADKDKDKEKIQAALRVGANLPGPFHPYNVNGRFGPRTVKDKDKDEETEGHYHCPVSEHAEDPMVLVFTRDTEVGDKLKSLLQKLDAVTKANTKIRLGATVVFLDKVRPEPEKDLLKVLGIPEKPDDQKGKPNIDGLLSLAGAVASEDRMRDLAASLKEKFAGMFTELNPFTKQNLVVVCIGNDNDDGLKKYNLDLNHKATVVLYNKLEIRAVHDYEDLDDAKIDAIMKDVADKLGARQK